MCTVHCSDRGRGGSARGGGGFCPGGCLPGGVSAQRGVSAWGMYPSMHWGRHPPVDRMTDRCKNITLRTVKIPDLSTLPTLCDYGTTRRAPLQLKVNYLINQYHLSFTCRTPLTCLFVTTSKGAGVITGGKVRLPVRRWLCMRSVVQEMVLCW